MTTPPTGPPPALERALTARLRVGQVAVAFREQVAAGDLARAWPLIEPELRLAWAREWARDHHARPRWHCPKRLALRLSCPEAPADTFFTHFADDRIHRLRQVEAAGRSHPEAGLPVLTADTEVLYARPERPDAWGTPDDPRATPMLMRWNGTAWRVLTYGSLHHPDPQQSAPP